MAPLALSIVVNLALPLVLVLSATNKASIETWPPEAASVEMSRAPSQHIMTKNKIRTTLSEILAYVRSDPHHENCVRNLREDKLLKIQNVESFARVGRQGRVIYTSTFANICQPHHHQ